MPLPRAHHPRRDRHRLDVYVPAALVRQHGIRVVPLQIVIGGGPTTRARRPRRTPSPRRTMQSSAARWRATTAESSTPRGTGFLPYSMDLPEP